MNIVKMSNLSNLNSWLKAVHDSPDQPLKNRLLLLSSKSLAKGKQELCSYLADWSLVLSLPIKIQVDSCGEESSEFRDYLLQQGFKDVAYGSSNTIGDIQSTEKNETTNYLWSCYCNELTIDLETLCLTYQMEL